jgi:hypothetical protein
MIQFLEPGKLTGLNWPLRTLVPPTMLDINGGLSICVNNNLDAGFLQAFGQLGDKKLGPTIISRRDRNKWRRYQCDFHHNLDAPLSPCFKSGSVAFSIILGNASVICFVVEPYEAGFAANRPTKIFQGFDPQVVAVAIAITEAPLRT